MDNFKKFGGQRIDDLGKYVRDYVQKHRDVVLYVGTDSKQMRRKTIYATAIVMWHVGKGAHIIFSRKSIPKQRDLFQRLYHEVEMSQEVALYLEKEITGYYYFKWTKELLALELDKPLDQISNGLLERYQDKAKFQNQITVDLDLNPNANHKSNMVHDTGVGVIEGCGFRCRTKPHATAATSAADLLCK